MQATISQCLSAIVGMNAAMLVSESERDAVLHQNKTILLTIALASNMMLFLVDAFILLFRYKAYLATIVLLIIDKVIEFITNKVLKQHNKKTGRVLYLDELDQEQLKHDKENLIAPVIIKNFGKEKEVKESQNEK